MSESTWGVIASALIGAISAIVCEIISYRGKSGNNNSSHKEPPKPKPSAAENEEPTKQPASGQEVSSKPLPDHKGKLKISKISVILGISVFIAAGIIIFYFRLFAPTPVLLLLNGVEYTDSKNLCTIDAVNVSTPEKKNAVRIKVNNTDESGYCSWVLPLEKYDASAKTSLTFWVKGENGGEQFNVGICDSNTFNGQEYKAKMTATSKWKKVTIALDKFDGQNLGALDNLSIGFETTGNYVIFIADVCFEP